MLLQKIAVFIFVSVSLTFVSSLEEDEDSFLGEPEYLPEQQNWFRVNTKGVGEDEQVRPQRDVVVNPRVLEREEDEQEETYTRNRRLYTPPAIVRDGGRPQPLPQRRDGGDQCRCDMEYVLKYRGVQPRGEYQVKVYHEETGKFTGEQEQDHRHYHDHQDHHRGWTREYEYADRKDKALPPAYRNKYEYYTEPPSSQQRQQQQQQQGRLLQRQQTVQQQERPRYQYYVEEVVDDGGDRVSSGERRRGEIFVRGNGPAKSRVIRRNKYQLPPPKALKSNRKLVKLARFIVSKAEWGMVAIISGKGSDFGGYPYSEYFRMSDGVAGNGSGIPYIYMRMSVLDACGDYGDLEINEASVTVALNEGDDDEQDICSRENSGRMTACTSVTLSGRIIPVTSTVEIEFAENALMSKHRKLEKDGFFAKLVISQVVVFTNSGSGNAHRLNVDEYLDYS